jgi:hypothetical protein
VEKALTTLAGTRPETYGDLWIGATRGQDAAPRVTLAWTPRDGTPTASVAARASGADGSVLFDGQVPAGGASFAAPPGRLTITRTLSDADGGALDRESVPFDVPDFAGRALTISSPVVLRARNGLEQRALAADDNAPPYAGHVFARGDRLMVRFAVFGAAAGDATITATLLSRTGTALAKLPVTRRGGRDAEYELQLPMSSVAQGDYMIAVEASHGDAQVKALVPFRAVP